MEDEQAISTKEGEKERKKKKDVHKIRSVSDTGYSKGRWTWVRPIFFP